MKELLIFGFPSISKLFVFAIIFRFPRYAVVDIIEDADKMEELQTSGHGGFNKKMILACGIRGIVNKVGNGSVYVECVNGDKYVFVETLYSMNSVPSK